MRSLAGTLRRVLVEGTVLEVFMSLTLWSQSKPSLEQSAREIIERNCFACHGAPTMSGLDLRQRETMLTGGKRGPAIVPGNAEGSLLYQAVAGTGELKMPLGRAPLPASD